MKEDHCFAKSQQSFAAAAICQPGWHTFFSSPFLFIGTLSESDVSLIETDWSFQCFIIINSKKSVLLEIPMESKVCHLEAFSRNLMTPKKII